MLTLDGLDRLVEACVAKRPYAALEAQELTNAKIEELDSALRSYGLGNTQ